jgi:hypothetical protein
VSFLPSITHHPILLDSVYSALFTVAHKPEMFRGGLVCVVSCRVVSCRVVSCRVVSCRVVSTLRDENCELSGQAFLSGYIPVDRMRGMLTFKGHTASCSIGPS